MVSKRKFNRIKRENPESRIWQRSWKQELYRNRLYKMIKKGLKKSDADAILTKEKYDNEKKTWEYISSEYGTTKKWAIQMIKKWYLELVVDNFDKFSGLDKEFAMFVLQSFNWHWYTVFGKNYKEWESWANAIRELCALIAKNADKISWLDKEFFDLYLNFNIKLYDEVTCWYHMRYATRTRWNSIGPLLDGIEFIEWVDEKLLLDYCLDLINSYQNEFEGRGFIEWDPEGDLANCCSNRVRDACVNLVTKATIKIPASVWKRVRVFECFDKSTLDFSTFYDRLEWFNFSEYFKAKLGDHEPSSYYINKMKRIPIDDFEKLLIEGSWNKGIWLYLNIPPYWTDDWEKRYALVVKYLDVWEILSCLRNNNKRDDYKPLLDWFTRYTFDNYNWKLQSCGVNWFKHAICQEFWRSRCEGCNSRPCKEPVRIFEMLQQEYEKDKKCKQIKEKEEQENLERQKIEQNIKKNYSYWIELFLWGWKYADYVKNLLLKTKVNWPVSKNEFYNLYHKLTPEEQKKLLKLFRRVELY